MRIFFAVAIGVVHTMHDRIRAGHEVRRSLHKPCKKIDCLFNPFARSIHLMRSKPVKKKRMKEKR